MDELALVCGTFHLDPVQALDGDLFEWHLRLATANRYVELVEEAREQGKER